MSSITAGSDTNSPELQGKISNQAWAYPDTGATRDLRLDLMRGLVVPLLFASHFDFFSALMFIGWERFGAVSTAEIYVILAGIVVGMVYGKRIKRDGMRSAIPKIMDRAIDLYRASIVMILIVAVIRYIPWIDSTIITTFHSPFTGDTFQLYPPMDAGIAKTISQALLLRIGPHQFQIVGMYVVMFVVFTPITFYMLSKGRWKMLATISWALYLISSGSGETMRPLGAQYEWAFPTLTWQLIYVHAIIIGYHKQEVWAFFRTQTGQYLVYASMLCALALLLFSWNNPVPQFAGTWQQLTIISPDMFHQIYDNYFKKNELGIGRLFNAVVLFITAYAILTRFWVPINKALGWFLIPLGQASLYVFFIHVFLLLAVHNTPFLEANDFWVNTLLHIIILAITWVMVKTEFLFRWVPR